ncbi:nicotinate phosphoribosyltransferase [Persicobacter sp. CCB-QB2]|uniref:nicotinate phosphoribosyltransferase n=1 Tax=Persicobacter sp. CCB-QB2 TaxID=1561025 RepID=UPI0006A990A7|nr:nicotinate phosphoribosyltransferase [Persicobacter sp. CCB-QB2]
MNHLSQIYQSNLALLTDLYQLTMAYGYWKEGKQDQEAVYELYFRKNPFDGGYTIAAGLQFVIDYLENWSFDEPELQYLSGLKGPSGSPLFETAFIDYLKTLRFTCDVEAVEEGTVIFPLEPILKIKGPLLQAQLIETPLLTIINFQTLVATKASRLRLAAETDTLLEFGLRRAQGIDGGITASRAAFIGGVNATSDVQAGMLFGIPVKGTHAHSWVLAFDSEEEAFESFANAMPDNTILLVDTYDTLEGVKKAIQVMKRLSKKKIPFHGIRLDSGDLAYLSQKARKLLDEAGFFNTVIVASNDLDEHIIRSLKKEQGAKIDVWGVGTKLVTAYDQPALGGVYKLTQIKNKDGQWEPKIKLSEQAVKVTTQGSHQIRRFYDEEGKMVADMIYDQEIGADAEKIIDPSDATRRKKIKKTWLYQDLLVPVFEGGKLQYLPPALEHLQKRTIQSLHTLDASVKRFTNPHSYPVGLEPELDQQKRELIFKLREQNS